MYDILFAGSTDGWLEFRKLISTFVHSGIEIVSGQNRLVYLGLYLGKVRNELYLIHESFAETKLVDIPEVEWTDKRDGEKTTELRKTSGKRAVGMMIWLLQNRPDISQKLCNLDSAINSCVGVHSEFAKWCRSENKLMTMVGSDQFRIISKSALRRNPQSNMEYLNILHLFVFSDAIFASIRNEVSVESYICALGRAVARNGDILCAGNNIDGGSRRIARVCRSPLASEAIGLGNAADLGLFLRVLVIEMIGGLFLKELVGPSRIYKLVTPFGASPSIESVLEEMKGKTLTDVEKEIVDLRSGSEIEDLIEKGLMNSPQQVGAILSMCGMLLLTDSANCYASLLRGKPATLGNVCVSNSLI